MPGIPAERFDDPEFGEGQVDGIPFPVDQHAVFVHL